MSTSPPESMSGGRSLYANIVSVTGNTSEWILTFALADNPDDRSTVVEKTTIILSPLNAKFLLITLGLVIEAVENSVGQQIPIDTDRVEKIKKAITAARRPPSSSDGT